MNRKLLTILALLLCFYAGKRLSDFEHRPIVVEIRNTHAPRGVQTAEHQEAIALVPLDAQYPEYTTVSEAIFSALRAVDANPSAQYYEWAGTIIRLADGKYSFSEPETDFIGDEVGFRRAHPAGSSIVGGYHTHPCLPHHDVEYFSPQDLVLPIFMHKIAVMGDFCTGNIHVFIPGDQPDVEHPPGDQDDIWMTKGRIMGKFTNRTGPAPL